MSVVTAAPRALYALRWWPTWVLVGALAVLGRLPCRVRIALGLGLGGIMHRLMRRRLRIARSNLDFCFPDWSEARQAELARRHFDELGIAVLETAAAWTLPGRALDRRCRISGLEHIKAALTSGNGVIVMAAHLACIEMSMQLMARHQPGYAIYRRNKNPVLDRVILAGRSRQRVTLVEREDMRRLLSALRSNEVIWFSPDQDHGLAQGAFVEFFGRPAATVTTTARLAQRTGAPVLPLLYRRLPGCAGYELEVLAPLADFPGDDLVAATRRLNRVIEQQVFVAPEQYLWVHRRFKTRPPGAASIYGE